MRSIYLLEKSLQHRTVAGSTRTCRTPWASIQDLLLTLIIVNHIECFLIRVGGSVSCESEASKVV